MLRLPGATVMFSHEFIRISPIRFEKCISWIWWVDTCNLFLHASLVTEYIIYACIYLAMYVCVCVCVCVCVGILLASSGSRPKSARFALVMASSRVDQVACGCSASHFSSVFLKHSFRFPQLFAAIRFNTGSLSSK